jgi:hypothetical protein
MPKAVSDLSGATYPGTIWHNYMEKLHDASMTRKFELYDWRAPLKAKKEEEERQKALLEAQEKALREEQEKEAQAEEELNSVAQPTDIPEVGDNDNAEDTGENTEENSEPTEEQTEDPENNPELEEEPVDEQLQPGDDSSQEEPNTEGSAEEDLVGGGRD